MLFKYIFVFKIPVEKIMKNSSTYDEHLVFLANILNKKKKFNLLKSYEILVMMCSKTFLTLITNIIHTDKHVFEFSNSCVCLYFSDLHLLIL